MAKTWTVGLTPLAIATNLQSPCPAQTWWRKREGLRGLEAAKEHETDVNLAACCKLGKRPSAAVPASLSCRFGDGGSGWPVRVSEIG